MTRIGKDRPVAKGIGKALTVCWKCLKLEHLERTCWMRVPADQES